LRYETPPFYSVVGYNTSLSRQNLTILGAHATQVSVATVEKVLRVARRATALQTAGTGTANLFGELGQYPGTSNVFSPATSSVSIVCVYHQWVPFALSPSLSHTHKHPHTHTQTHTQTGPFFCRLLHSTLRRHMIVLRVPARLSTKPTAMLSDVAVTQLC
jgi:hypothetical protein